MKQFGPGIFDNDVAQSVRDEFTAAVAQGLSVYAAADRVLARPFDFLKENDRDQVFLALAALQLEHGVIQPKIKKNALTVIIMGDDLEQWESKGPELYAARSKVLQELRQKLVDTV
jgi:hypothetical protein